MINIIAVNLHNFRNKEHLQFHQNIGKAIAATGATVLKIEPQVQEWEACINKEEEALKRIIKSPFTDEIGEADKRRTHAYRGAVEINAIIGLHHFNPEVRAASKRLQIVFDSYGNITRKSVNEKKADYDSFIEDMKSERYANDVQTLRLLEWIGELAIANIEVDRLTQMRFDEAAQRSGIAVAEARADVDNAYGVIVRRINALMEIEGNEVLEHFIQRVNVVIEKFDR